MLYAQLHPYSLKEDLACVPSQEVVFPVQYTALISSLFSHFLSIDPLSSYPLLQLKRHTLPYTFPHASFSSFPLAGGKRTAHRSTGILSHLCSFHLTQDEFTLVFQGHKNENFNQDFKKENK